MRCSVEAGAIDDDYFSRSRWFHPLPPIVSAKVVSVADGRPSVTLRRSPREKSVRSSLSQYRPSLLIESNGLHRSLEAEEGRFIFRLKGSRKTSTQCVCVLYHERRFSRELPLTFCLSHLRPLIRNIKPTAAAAAASIREPLSLSPNLSITFLIHVICGVLLSINNPHAPSPLHTTYIIKPAAAVDLCSS